MSKPKQQKGFAKISRERQREIASQGGKTAHERGRAHTFNSDEAKAAGRRGGLAVSVDREHMARIGRAGGRARGVAHAKKQAGKAAVPS